MKPSRFCVRRVFVGVVALGLGGASSASWAQVKPAPVGAPAPVAGATMVTGPTTGADLAPDAKPAPRIYTRTFAIESVRPSLLAFWLDPAHHRAPAEWGFAPTPGDTPFIETAPRLPGNGNGPSDFKLPVGVFSIVAIDPQNALSASGTADGLRALEALLPTADVPLTQYEVEAEFYGINLADLPGLGLKFQALPEETPYSFGSVSPLSPDYQRRLEKLMTSKRVRLLSAPPRITTIDGVRCEVKQVSSTPVTWNETPARSAAKKASGPQRIAYINNWTGIRTTPTRLQNGLLSVVIEPHIGARVLSIQTIVREDQPFAIQMSPSKDARQIIVVVTPRRLRRVGK